jgi:hypothetical protein
MVPSNPGSGERLGSRSATMVITLFRPQIDVRVRDGEDDDFRNQVPGWYMREMESSFGRKRSFAHLGFYIS